MNTIFELLTYFVVYSILGWLMESIVTSISEKKITNTGFLYGPFCPIYGIGAIIMIVFLSYFKDYWILLFIISFFVLSTWEYIVGTILEKIFKAKYWDYSDQKFNIKGRVCLIHSICWGALGLVFIKYIHPFLAEKIVMIDQLSIYIAIYTILIIMTIDLSISIFNVLNIKSTLEKVENLNKQIKEKLSEIKVSDKLVKYENIQLLVDKIKQKRDRIFKRLYKNVYRLKTTFPNINSKEFTEILSKKVELKKINLKKIKNRKEEK